SRCGGQSVRRSLLQGACLYTTQIGMDAERGDDSFYGVMAKTYPPGIHQPLIFECADGYIHLSVMSGLATTRTINDILGLAPIPHEETEGPRNFDIQTMEAERQRDTIKTWKKDELVRALVACNYAVEAVLSPEEQFDHPQLQANHMVATVDDPELVATTQVGVPIHLLGTPGAITSGQPRVGEHNQE